MSQKIIDLVTAVVAPAIPEPYELVDIEYEKLGGDYVLSVLIDKPGHKGRGKRKRSGGYSAQCSRGGLREKRLSVSNLWTRA